MKHLIVILLFVVTAVTSAFAGGRPSKEELDAAMKAGRQDFATKQAVLAKELRIPGTQAAKTAADQVYNLMLVGIRQTGREIFFYTGEEHVKANKHLNELEAVANKYHQLSSNISANSQQLIQQAEAFAKTY